ncbi:MAG: hypothetical protein ACOX0E_09495 [Syntrophomonadaceae bacterium]
MARQLEKSLINIIDRIETVKQKIVQTEDELERKQLLQQLDKLQMLRSYYIKLVDQ